MAAVVVGVETAKAASVAIVVNSKIFPWGRFSNRPFLFLEPVHTLWQDGFKRRADDAKSVIVGNVRRPIVRNREQAPEAAAIGILSNAANVTRSVLGSLNFETPGAHITVRPHHRRLLSVPSSNRERSNSRILFVRRRRATRTSNVVHLTGERRARCCTISGGLSKNPEVAARRAEGYVTFRIHLCKTCREVCDGNRASAHRTDPHVTLTYPVAHRAEGPVTRNIPLCTFYIGRCERAQAAVRRAMGSVKRNIPLCTSYKGYVKRPEAAVKRAAGSVTRDKSRAHSEFRDLSVGRMHVLRWFRGTSPVLCSSPGQGFFRTHPSCTKQRKSLKSSA